MLAFLVLLPLALAAPLPKTEVPSAQLFFRPHDQHAWSGPDRRDDQAWSGDKDRRVSAADSTKRSDRTNSEVHLDSRLFIVERDAESSPPSMPVAGFMLSDDITSNMAHALDSIPHSSTSDDTSKRGLSIAQSIANLEASVFHRFQARSSTNSIDGERDASEMELEE